MGMTARAEIHFIIDQAIQNMQRIQHEARATGETVGGAFTGSEADLASYNQALNTVGRSFVVTGAAITGAVGLAVNSFMSFEQQMDAVRAVSNASIEDMEKLTANALKIGQETSFNANEVGAAMEILAKAGMELELIYGGVAEGAVRLSEATGVNITLSAETAAAAMTVFGYAAEDADRVMNVIAQSANASMLEVDDWSAALRYAAPVAAILGYEIEDLAHMMVILGNSGIRGSVAATSLRNIMVQLTDSTSNASTMIAEAGISIQNTDGSMKGLDQIITELVPHWNSLDDAARSHFATQAFGVRGGPAFLVMMDAQAEAINRGGNAFLEAGEAMEDVGDIYTMSQIRMDNLGGSMERLRGSTETLMINFGSRLAPAIRLVVDVLDWFIDALANTNPVLQTVVMVLASLSGGALLLGGSMLLLLPQILATQQAFVKLGGVRGVLTLLVGPIRAIGMAFMTSLGPITLVAAAATALYLAWKHNFLGIRDLVDSFVGWLGDAWGAVKEFIDGVSWLFGGGKKKFEAELDISTNTDEDFDTYTGIDGVGKKASLAITTLPDDMFIEYVYDADGTVIGYDVKITSSTDGTEQTGRILSSSRDENDPDLIHMEVELASGETVQGTYNEIEGTFSQIPGNVNVGATFVGDAYIVTQRELPDGTMGWVITESANPQTGEVFADVVDSYSGEQGEAFILVQPDGDGPAFWQKVDLETGIPTDIEVPIDADTGMFDGRLKAVRAENGEHTVVVNGDDEPFGIVLNGIMDPATGNKLITLQLADGTTFLAEVDAVTGEIITYHEIEIEADTTEAKDRLETIQGLMRWFASWAEPQGGLLGFLGRVADRAAEVVELFQSWQALLTGDWGNVDWRLMLDMAGLQGVVDIIDGAIAAYEKLKGLFGTEEERLNTDNIDDPEYKQELEDTWNYDYSVPYDERDQAPLEPGEVRRTEWKSSGRDAMREAYTFNDFGKAMRASTIGAGLFDKSLQLLDATATRLHPTLGKTASTVPIIGASMRTTEGEVMGAAGGIAGSGDLVGSSFGNMAVNIAAQSALAAASGVSNFGLLNQGVLANALGAQVGASSSFATLQSVASSHFGDMRSDTQSKMSALQGAVASTTTQARATGTAQFSQLNANLGSHLSTMQSNAASRMQSLQSSVSTQTTTAKSNAVNQMSQMNTGVAGHMLGMQLNTATKLGLMASSADTQGSNMASNLKSGASTGASNVNTQLAKIAGYVTGQGANASVSALIAGRNIGDSFARGMESMLGRVRGAASAMVAEANRAIIMKAMISSPSKLFMRLGEYMGEGVEVGILDKIAAVERASERLVHVPRLEGGFNAGAGVGQVSALGGANINVTIVTLPHAEWTQFNEAQLRNSRFVQSWQTPEAIAQYLGG